MDRNEIIAMAKEAGLARWHVDLKRWVIDPGVEKFAALVAAKEREACAQVCDGFKQGNSVIDECVAALRARGDA